MLHFRSTIVLLEDVIYSLSLPLWQGNTLKSQRRKVIFLKTTLVNA